MSRRRKRPTACFAAIDTPLRMWHAAKGRTWRWLEVQTGLGERTIYRVAAGRACNAATAVALSDVTGIPVRTLVRGMSR